MAYSERAKRYASDILEKRRGAALEKTESRRNEAFSKIPELENIESEIKALGICSLKALLSGDIESTDFVKPEIEELKAARTKLLISAGLAPDVLDEFHFCRMCNDRGYIEGGKICACKRNLLSDFAMGEIREVSSLELCSFDTFSLDYYSKDFSEEFGASPRENMKTNLKICRDFAGAFPWCDKSLLMLGDAGLGKTHLALSIANSVLGKGYEVVYCSAPPTLKQIEKEQFENGRETTTIDSLKRCDLLVLDDLGAEYINAFVVSSIYDIVNTRLIANKSTIYTTNIVSEDQLAIRYSEKVSSRLLGSCTVLPFFGEDIRLMKNN